MAGRRRENEQNQVWGDEPLPPPLLEAVASPVGGRVVLVLGAGCSCEQPTGLPLAGQLARQCHDQLVADRILAAGDCLDPDDLSAVADAVVTERGSQRELVERFPPDRFRLAEPNDGYRLAAALLRERALNATLTLNFDLAPLTALGAIGAGEEVTVIEGPEEFHRLGTTNLVYLHRSISRDPDELILRSDQLEAVWRETRWEEIVAQRFLGGTVTVFVGLGTPAAVLLKTARKIVELLGNDARVYVVDPADPADSRFFAELGLPDEVYIRLGWSDFIHRLCDRLLIAHRSQLEDACATMIREHGWDEEDVVGICERLMQLGVLGIGALRARWLMRQASYAPHPREPEMLRLVGDLVIGVAMVARLTGRTVHFDEEGIVELESADGARALLIVCSGCGSRRWEAVEAEVDLRRRVLERRGHRPRAALVAGVPEPRRSASAPDSIISGQLDSESIVVGGSVFQIRVVDEVRGRADLAEALVA